MSPDDRCKCGHPRHDHGDGVGAQGTACWAELQCPCTMFEAQDDVELGGEG